MKFNDIIRTAMKDSGMTQQRLGDALGIRQTAVSNVLRRPEIMLGTLLSFLDAMGYEVIVQKKTQGRRKEGQMVLTNEEEA